MLLQERIKLGEQNRSFRSRPCSRCGNPGTGCEDFQSGIYQEANKYVRRHRPRFTIRCLNPNCRHAETILDITPTIGDPI